MRTPGLCLALVASAQLVLFSSPAFAADDTSTRSTTSTSTPSAAPAPTAAPASAEGMVLVHVNSPSPVTLQHRSGETGTWETLCTSPCDVKAPVSDQYQVTGDGLNASRPFMLDGSKGKVNLDVTPGSQGKAKVATGFLIAGGVLAVAGIIVLVAVSGHGFVSGTNDSGTTHNSHTNGVFAGGALLFAGIAAGLYGAGTLINNQHSDVEGDTVHPQPTRGQAESVLKTAQLPVPNAPAFIVPVFQGTF